MRFLLAILLLVIAVPAIAHEPDPQISQQPQTMLIPRISYQPQVSYESVPVPQMQTAPGPMYRRVLFPRLWGIRPNVWVQTPYVRVCVGGNCR